MIVSAFFVPHCPAAVLEKNSEEGSPQSRIPQVLAYYDQMVRIFREKEVESLIVVSGQTAPYIKEFAIHDSEDLHLNLSLFRNHNSATLENNQEMLQKIASIALREKIHLQGLQEALDFGQAIPLYICLQNNLNLPVTAIHISHESKDIHKAFGKVIAEATLESNSRIGLIISADLSNKISKTESQSYDSEARSWNKEFLRILQGNLVKLNTLDPFITEDVGGLYTFRAAKILEGVLSKYLYKSKNSFYEEAFGIGYGGVEWEVLE